MKKTDSLNILQMVQEQISSMSTSELFDYMMQNSESFKQDIYEIKNSIYSDGISIDDDIYYDFDTKNKYIEYQYSEKLNGECEICRRTAA